MVRDMNAAGTEPKKRSKADEAYSLIKGKIMDGAYAPGCRIVVRDLAHETGISATPLREGIRRLESEGWVETVPDVGARVTPFTVESHKQTMELLARLEGFATVLALPNLTEDDYAHAHAINEELARLSVEEDQEASGLNRAFHDVFYQKCGFPHLQALIITEIERLDFIKRRVVYAENTGRVARRKISVQEHEELLALMEGGAPDGQIEAYARQHKENALHYRHELK